MEKSGLKITAVRVGEFEHLEYDTWGDKQRDFRVDFVITNTGNEPISTPWKYVILDDASNQYDEKFLGGTLESKEIYPNVTIRGYLLFDTINENSSAIKIITSRYSYPVDDVWEFNINIHNKF